MPEYVPTTERVEKFYTDWDQLVTPGVATSEAFHRWLAGVRAEAGAAALEAAANETISVAYSASTNGPAEYRDQPVLDAGVRKWLNARADVIRASAPEGEHTEPTGGTK